MITVVNFKHTSLLNYLSRLNFAESWFIHQAENIWQKATKGDVSPTRKITPVKSQKGRDLIHPNMIHKNIPILRGDHMSE